MATQRYISTSFWDDGWIQELDPSEKLLYLYLLTNPWTNIAGVYRLTVKRIHDDTGFNRDTVRMILDRFERKGKAMLFGEWIIIPSWPAHQKWQTKPNIRSGIESILRDLPADVISKLNEVKYRFPIAEYLQNYKNPVGPGRTDTDQVEPNYLDSDSDSDSDLDFDLDHKNGAADEKLPDESESMPPWPDDEDLSQPAADPSPEPPVAVSPKPPSRMKDELADHYQTKMLKVQPVETWGNVRVEREQLTVLAGKTRKLRPKTPFATDVELADAILITYYHARDQGRDSYWKGAPFSPSALSTRWAQVITMLEQSFKSQIAAAEFDRKQQDAIDWLHGGKR